MNFVKVGSAVAAAAEQSSTASQRCKLLAIQKHSSQRVLFYVHIGLIAATTNTVGWVLSRSLTAIAGLLHI
jgi:hypothetical protein